MAGFLTISTTRPHAECAVVTEPFAKEHYGSDDAAVGQTFQILGIPFTIIGVFKESVSRISGNRRSRTRPF